MANVLANIFGASPVQPLEKHVGIAYRCAKQLKGFFSAAVAGDWQAAAAVRDEIEKLEHEADDVKKQIRLHLPKSLFMPVPREDLLELLLVQDKIANRTKDVSGLVLGRQLEIPPQIAEQFLEFVDRNIDAAKQARKSVRELDELFTAGFRGAEVELVSGLIEELDRIETDTDDKQAALRAALFAIEKTLDPIDAMFTYQVIELTGEIADMAGNASVVVSSCCSLTKDNNKRGARGPGSGKWKRNTSISAWPPRSVCSWRGGSAPMTSPTLWRHRWVSKALTIKQAILVAAVFEFAGAVLAGGEVTSTIRKGIVRTPICSRETEELLVYGMLCGLAGSRYLAAGGVQKRLAGFRTTHSIVGAIVGFAAVGIGIDAVQWGKVGTIVMSWVVSPLTAGFHRVS